MTDIKAALNKAAKALMHRAEFECDNLAFHNLGVQADSLERIIDINESVMRITMQLHDDLVAVLIDYSDASVKEQADWYKDVGVVTYDGLHDVMTAAWNVVDLFREDDREAAE